MTPATPAATPDPLDVDIAEIPLPPDDVAAQILAEEESEAMPAKTPPAAPKAAAEVATLAFVAGRERSRTVALAYPFVLEGTTIASVTVKRLTGFEVGEFVRRAMQESGDFDRFELYAAATDLPAPVLRGLDQDDWADVMKAAADFLPRSFRASA